MDEKIIIDLYNDGYTLRHISEMFKTNHHTISRVLIRNGIEISRRKTRKPFTREWKANIILACKGRKGWCKGSKMSKMHKLKNMKNHLNYDVSLEWLNSFDDFEKLKYLNKSITRGRDKIGFTTEIYKLFIEKFYSDTKFNDLYSKWIQTKDRWIKPSLDHIQPKSKKGSLLIDNLQFISWFENRAKSNMDIEEWNKIKLNINYYL